MKRKYFRTLVALVLAVSLCLVMAVPASADGVLADVSATADNYTAGATGVAYTIAFTTATSGNLTTVEMEFPADFDVSGVGEGTCTGIGAGSASNSTQVVIYTVTTPVTIAGDVAISIELTGIVNTDLADDYVVKVTTIDDGLVIIDGPTDAPFEIVADTLDEYLVEPAATTQTAGTAFSVNITAVDQFDNPLGTAYAADGPYIWVTTAGDAPDTSAPDIGTLAEADFTEGVATKAVTLYKAETGVTFTATDNNSITGVSTGITVEHIGLVAYLVEPDAPSQIAGTAFSVNITAISNFENVVDDDETLNAYAFTFTGPSNAPDGTAWDYPTSANFSAGIWPTNITLVKVEEVELKVADNQTTSIFGTSDFFVEGINLDSTFYNSSGTVTVTVGDESEDTQTSIRAWSTSTTSDDKIIIVIPETDPDTGIFEGSFDLVNGTPGTGELYVEHDDVVTITYPTDISLPVDPLNVADVDDVVPTITSFLPAASENTSDATPEIAATLTDSGGSGIDENTIEMTVGGLTVVTSYNGTSGVVSYTPSENLTDGSWEVTVNVSDVAENPAVQAEWSFTVDTGAPTITALTPADGAYVNDNTPEISAVLSNGLSGVNESTIVMTVGGVTVEPDDYDYDTGTGALTYTPSDNLSEGSHTVTVDVEDLASNPAVSANWTFTVDVPDPVISIYPVETPTSVDTQAISGTGAEINVDEITLTVNDAVVAITENITAGTWASTENVTLTEGDNTVLVTITDLAGNGGSANTTILLDTTEPAVTHAVAVPALIQTDTVREVIFSANVTDEGGTGVASVSANLTAIGGAEDQAMTDDNMDGIYEYTWTDLTVAGADTYELTITATDDVGNTNDTVDITLEVITDADDPVIESTTVEYPLGYESAREGDDVVITAVVTDNTTDIASVTIDATDIGLGAAVGLSLTETDTYTYIATATLTVGAEATVGTKTLTITATDLADNEATANVTVVVVAALTAYNLDLVEGWNLISLPLIPDNSDISEVISVDTLSTDNLSSVTIIRTYDAVTGIFPLYTPDTGSGNLTAMEDGVGYWVFMNEDAILTIHGQQWTSPGELPRMYDVVVGWNLIGFKSVDSMSDEDYLVSLHFLEGYELYPVLWSYDAETGAYSNVKGVVDGMVVGHGFWIWIIEAYVIVPPE